MTDPAADATRCEPLAPAEIKTAFLSACRAELAALKPGNVHVHAAGHGMDVAHFEAAAQAAAPVIARPGLSFGQRVEMAVGESLAAAGCNTNLGIILLCAPLATAALLPAPAPLHKRVGAVLSHLSQEDGDRVYAAIRAANPGGLGTTDAADVARSPDIALLDAMALAAPRDRIAANYVSGLRDIFEDHLPLLTRIRSSGGDTSPPAPADATATLYMSLLSRFPDSHIRRKFGMETAAHVQRLAGAARPSWHPVVSPASYPALLALDALLKSNGWNPGTTADFVVATLFAESLSRQTPY